MEHSKNRKLVISKLSEELLAFTKEYGSCLAQACAICFEDQKHQKGVTLNVEGTYTESYEVIWPEITEQMRNCWKDDEYATEHAAYGIAFLLIIDLTEYTIIERSRKGTGFDYWIGKDIRENDLPFQNMGRLEVSGIRKGNISLVKSRVREKLNQVKKSDSSLIPAFVVVVEFSSPLSHMVKKDE